MRQEDWIKVEDRLPEVGQTVLVASYQYQKWMPSAYVLTYAGKEKIYEDVEIDKWLDHYGQKVGYPTHWMPIELPKSK